MCPVVQLSSCPTFQLSKCPNVQGSKNPCAQASKCELVQANQGEVEGKGGKVAHAVPLAKKDVAQIEEATLQVLPVRCEHVGSIVNPLS